jgi:hypothetical protein
LKNKKETFMADYVQCPNCGGYKVVTKEIKGRETKQEKFKFSLGSWLFVSFGCAAIIYPGIYFLTIPFIFSTDKSLAESAKPFLIPAICIASLIPFIFSWARWKALKSLEREGKIISLRYTVTTGYNYSCNICGNQWSWMIGTPMPKIIVKPDLIAKVEA